MACAQVNTFSRHPTCPVLGALYPMQSIHSSPRRPPAARGSGPRRLDRPYPERRLLCVRCGHTFLLSTGAELG